MSGSAFTCVYVGACMWHDATNSPAHPADPPHITFHATSRIADLNSCSNGQLNWQLWISTDLQFLSPYGQASLRPQRHRSVGFLSEVVGLHHTAASPTSLGDSPGTNTVPEHLALSHRELPFDHICHWPPPSTVRQQFNVSHVTYSTIVCRRSFFSHSST